MDGVPVAAARVASGFTACSQMHRLNRRRGLRRCYIRFKSSAWRQQNCGSGLCSRSSRHGLPEPPHAPFRGQRPAPTGSMRGSAHQAGTLLSNCRPEIRFKSSAWRQENCGSGLCPRSRRRGMPGPPHAPFRGQRPAPTGSMRGLAHQAGTLVVELPTRDKVQVLYSGSRSVGAGSAREAAATVCLSHRVLRFAGRDPLPQGRYVA